MGAAAARAGVRAVPKPSPSVTSGRSGRGEFSKESSGASPPDLGTSDGLQERRSPVADAPNRTSTTSFRSENPRTSSDIHRRNDPLVERLRNVYLDSVDEVVERPPYPLKLHKREGKVDPHAGGSIQEGLSKRDVPITVNIPEGFATYQQVMLALVLHRQEPENWTVDKVAAQLKLPTSDVRSLFKYYAVFAEVRNRDSEDYPGLVAGTKEMTSELNKSI